MRDLTLLDQAVSYWVDHFQYREVELPWVIPERFTAATRPADRAELSLPQGNLIASGEQSFLMLMSDRALPAAPGYVGWSPCFRAEPCLDELHRLTFLKAEVFIPVNSYEAGRNALPLLLERQRRLFQHLIALSEASSLTLTLEPLEEAQLDWLLNGIEIGSYGVRAFEDVFWYLYGTALALPRFRQALAAKAP